MTDLPFVLCVSLGISTLNPLQSLENVSFGCAWVIEINVLSLQPSK